MKYVVEIQEQPQGDTNAVAASIAENFKVDMEQAVSLLRRLPGVVTQPVEESQAQSVAELFRQAGLKPSVRPAQATPEAPAAAAATRKPQAKPKERAKRERRTKRTQGDMPRAKRRRGSLRRKLLSVAIIPTILTIIGAFVVTWFTVRPALYEQLLASARNPAIATAASLSSTLEESSAEGGIDYLQLQETIQITRQAFQRQDISFVVATDTEGNPLSGWFAGAEAIGTNTVPLRNAVREQSLNAVRQGREARSGRDVDEATVQLPGRDNVNIEVVAQPLIGSDGVLGAIVVGVTDRAVSAKVRQILINLLVFSLIPVMLAIMIAAVRARTLTGNVLYLTRSADQISRGDLETSVNLKSDDELNDLSEALERMRINMQEALLRLRRRRS